MAGQESSWLDGLARTVGLEVDAAHVADVIVSTLREIEAVLRPVIGRGGFDALYVRCIYLTGLTHPWLAGAHDPASTPVDLVALRHAIAQQGSAAAGAGGGALLRTFNDLLITLIGRSLTERLLASVAIRPIALSGGAAQDTLR